MRMALLYRPAAVKIGFASSNIPRFTGRRAMYLNSI
jgi:hypothetical protein